MTELIHSYLKCRQKCRNRGAELLAVAGDSDQSALTKQEEYLRLIRDAQLEDGEWGPYADSPLESFDTAVTLLALKQLRRKPGVEEMIRLTDTRGPSSVK